MTAPTSAYLCACGRPMGRYDAECRTCFAKRVIGFAVVPAPLCASCGLEAVDPLWAPGCSSACREQWETQERLRALRKSREVTP